MDPDSKLSALVRLAPAILAALIIIGSVVLVAMGKLTGSELGVLIGFATTMAGASRMMTVPTSTSTTKQTDPSSGVVTETKTQQPLGMPPPTVAVAPLVTEPPKGPTP